MKLDVGLPVGGSTGSALSHLEGALSGRSHAAGSLIGLDPCELTRKQSWLAAAGAGYLSLETAAAMATVPMLLEARSIDRSDVVVVFDTGAGFKSEPPRELLSPLRVPNDPDQWEGILSKVAEKAPQPGLH